MAASLRSVNYMVNHICEPIQSRRVTSSGSDRTVQDGDRAPLTVGAGALPFEAVAEPLASESGKPEVQWVSRDLKPPIFNQAAELFACGRTVRQVKEILGISYGEAGRLRLRAAAEGLLEPNGEDDEEEAEIPLVGVFTLG